MNSSLNNCKPFIKWVGGKRQLLQTIENNLPLDLKEGKAYNYIEPFIGGGALLYFLLQKYDNIESAIINDINKDLANAYLTVKEHPEELIEQLGILQEAYLLKDEQGRKDYFLEQRATFNTKPEDKITNTALLIFLNKTCFNGLYRVNKKGGFNVPHGRYKNPKILDKDTILADSQLLQKVTILNGDFEKTLDYAPSNHPTLFYLDPPYKPISKTASFNAYSNAAFEDEEQTRLQAFCNKINALGHHFLLSNSDPQNEDEENTFFDDLYAAYSILRVSANRAINSKGNKRGAISELLIKNY